jgi:hypothetical protein
LPAHLSAHISLSIPALDAFQLHLTPFNSTPTFARIRAQNVTADGEKIVGDIASGAESLVSGAESTLRRVLYKSVSPIARFQHLIASYFN